MEKDVLKEYLSQRALELKQSLRRHPKKLSKKELHELRLNLRRWRVAFWALRYSLPVKAFHKLKKRADRANKILGKKRELDVAMTDAKKYGLKTSFIKTSRREAKKKVERLLRSGELEELRKELGDFNRHLRRGRRVDLSPALRRLQEELRMASRKNHFRAKEYHHLRIQVKKARYLLEMFHQPMAGLKLLQDELGKIHDLEVLKKMV